MWVILSNFRVPPLMDPATLQRAIGGGIAFATTWYETRGLTQGLEAMPGGAVGSTTMVVTGTVTAASLVAPKICGWGVQMLRVSGNPGLASRNDLLFRRPPVILRVNSGSFRPVPGH